MLAITFKVLSVMTLVSSVMILTDWLASQTTKHCTSCHERTSVINTSYFSKEINSAGLSEMNS